MLQARNVEPWPFPERAGPWALLQERRPMGRISFCIGRVIWLVGSLPALPFLLLLQPVLQETQLSHGRRCRRRRRHGRRRRGAGPGADGRHRRRPTDPRRVTTPFSRGALSFPCLLAEPCLPTPVRCLAGCGCTTGSRSAASPTASSPSTAGRSASARRSASAPASASTSSYPPRPPRASPTSPTPTTPLRQHSTIDSPLLLPVDASVRSQFVVLFLPAGCRPATLFASVLQSSLAFAL